MDCVVGLCYTLSIVQSTVVIGFSITGQFAASTLARMASCAARYSATDMISQKAVRSASLLSARWLLSGAASR